MLQNVCRHLRLFLVKYFWGIWFVIQASETTTGYDTENWVYSAIIKKRLVAIPLNSIASFGSLAPVGLALLFCFSFIRRSLSIVTTWNQQYNIYVSITPQAWTRQEIHNILHGIHDTFQRAWSNTARHYDFHKYHRNWLAISHQAQKLFNADLLESANKVRCRLK